MTDVPPKDLAEALASAGLPPVHYYAEIDSTNDVALTLASHGAPEGTAVLAELQRAGRGRRGRSWFSPGGAGLYLSVVVRATGFGDRISLLTLAAGVVAAEAITQATGLPVELKWPNDVVVGRPWRKLAGVLCEASGLGTPEGAVVVGIGVNLLRTSYPPELGDRATSIDVELGRPIDRAALVVACLLKLRETMEQLRGGDASSVVNRWRALGRSGFGQRVTWTDERGTRRAVARDIADDGALIVHGEPGAAHEIVEERLVAGDVRWERLSRD